MALLVISFELLNSGNQRVLKGKIRIAAAKLNNAVNQALCAMLVLCVAHDLHKIKVGGDVVAGQVFAHSVIGCQAPSLAQPGPAGKGGPGLLAGAGLG